jgi:alkylation response protein AidB-like acyl-CoA dehydrogenase
MSEAINHEAGSSVTLTDLQEEIRSVTQQFLLTRANLEYTQRLVEASAEPDATIYEQLVELGWVGLTVDEAHGGSGLGLVERCLILEEMGAVLFPAAFLSTGIVSDVLALGGAPDLVAGNLEALACGRLRFAFADGAAVTTSTSRVPTVVALGDGDASLAGDVRLVLDAGSADVLIVSARAEDGEMALFGVLADAPGLAREPAPTLDPTRSFADVSFNRTPARRLDAGTAEAGTRIALDRAAVALAAEQVGSARACLNLTIAYLKERRQFGAPIGSFQALKHRVATSYVALEAAREAVYLAADGTVTSPGPTRALASAAKACASEAFTHVAAEGIQLHGGIGFTWEYPAHLFYRRAIMGAHLLGTPAYHRARLADELEP